MSSRQPPHNTENDAAGRARYTDFKASRDRVRQRLDAAHPIVTKQRSLSFRWVYAAASTLLLCFIGWYGLQPPAYLQLADDYRIRIATDELSTTRAANRTVEEVMVATALSLYHQAKYTEAASAFSSLASREDEPKQQLFVFYQGVSYWLGHDPVAAIKTLAPLHKAMALNDLRYRTVSYVLALAYVDNKAFSRAGPLLEKLAEKEDGLGERAAKMLKVLPKAE
ncbi:MAG: hypothetical protein AB8H12_00130 [Lewinella sp.]